MSARIIVENLSYKTTEETLQQVFSESSGVENLRLMIDRDTDRSRGFAHVTFASKPDAEAAISALNGQEVDGRGIVVKFESGGGGSFRHFYSS